MLSGLILVKLFGVVNVTIDTVISFCTAIYIGGFNFFPLKPGLLRRQSLLRVAIRSSPDTVIESEASCWMHATDHSSIKNRMTRTHIAWRYLLRNGRFITTSHPFNCLRNTSSRTSPVIASRFLSCCHWMQSGCCSSSSSSPLAPPVGQVPRLILLSADAADSADSCHPAVA